MLMNECLSIAGLKIGIEIPDDIRPLHYGNEYLSSAEPDLIVSISHKDVREEILRRNEIIQNTRISPEQNERLAVYSVFFRTVAETLPQRGIYLLHGSAISYKGNGIVFSAPSGTGKSTFSASWKRCFPDDVTYINDDKPFVRISKDGIYICGSPWNGNHNLGENTAVPLKAICFLERDEHNFAVPISQSDAFAKLRTHAYLPLNGAGQRSTLELLYRTVSYLPGRLYKIGCNQDSDACLNIKDVLFNQ